MNKYQQQSKVFQALAHPVRLQILEALARRPLCVCELVLLTGRRQANISQHLALLREVGLVCTERTGWNVFYSLSKPQLESAVIPMRSFFQQIDLPQPTRREQGGNQVSGNKNNNGQWHGVPRLEIQWYPTVIADRCVGCGLCTTSCGRGVYAFDYEQNRPVVLEPEMCMVGCTTCATLCTQDAIEFPSTGYIRQLIRQKKLLRQSKDMLRDNREKYDLKVREPEGFAE
jgi:DNA-binding transcriptional ArsR family regulator/NAD-dependent dihydropyrimidine dehydrogenase PreA subunit